MFIEYYGVGMSSEFHVYGLKLPIISPGDDIVELIVRVANSQGIGFRDRDVLVVTSKILSKSMGLLVKIDTVEPSKRAIKISKKTGLDPRVVELILRESDELVAAIPFKKLVDDGVIDITKITYDIDLAYKALEYYRTVLITVRDGMLWSESGIDTSNHPHGVYSIPPRGLDRVARELSNKILRRTGKHVAVVICDTELFINGSLDIARGSYGIEPISKRFGELDMYGKPKFGGVDHVAHEICCTAALVMKQAGEGIPAVIIRGLDYEWCECGLGESIPMSIDCLEKALKRTIRHTIKVFGLWRVLKKLLF